MQRACDLPAGRRRGALGPSPPRTELVLRSFPDAFGPSDRRLSARAAVQRERTHKNHKRAGVPEQIPVELHQSMHSIRSFTGRDHSGCTGFVLEVQLFFALPSVREMYGRNQMKLPTSQAKGACELEVQSSGLLSGLSRTSTGVGVSRNEPLSSRTPPPPRLCPLHSATIRKEVQDPEDEHKDNFFPSAIGFLNRQWTPDSA
ncbi:uncharacterized protein [Narcine bancroftii]|uniref:uncharacterized protein n=1 Tax=Narcine bancroftii TaxID=1343680 RepID=UPI0038319F4D